MDAGAGGREAEAQGGVTLATQPLPALAARPHTQVSRGSSEGAAAGPVGGGTSWAKADRLLLVFSFGS